VVSGKILVRRLLRLASHKKRIQANENVTKVKIKFIEGERKAP
jgi:hypothetical protein